MKCCDIHAGMLTASIVIERATRVSDGQGGWTRTWASIGTVRAMWRGLSGGEYWMAQRVSPLNRIKAVIRFRGDANGAPYYSASDRVTHRGRTYAIASVLDIEDRREWLQLMLTEGAAS